MLRRLLFVAVVAVLAWLAVLFLPDNPPPRKPVESRSTAAPVARIPQYVDDARCAECHSDIHQAYRQHPMGRSMGPVHEVDDAADSHAVASFTSGQYRYEVLRDGEEVVHRETRLDENGQAIAVTSLPVAYAVGSAERGRSYLINRDGRLFMSPITWYPQKDRWDLSPGYEDHNSHFNRPVIARCVFCHANRAHPVEDSLATYEPPIFSGHAIGCQRCHGPGEDHVALHEGTAQDPIAAETIVNPARLEPKLRDAVCQQCHLSGAAWVLRRGKSLDDFRPGMPLEDVIRIFVAAEDSGGRAKFVGHVEQMHASLCFEASEGRMGCIACHDPHRSPPRQTRGDYYRSKCLSCHEQQQPSCSELLEVRQATGGDNCVACHMPARQTEIRHAAITDHRILRRSAVPSGHEAGESIAVATAIVPFHPLRADEEDLRRDLALALLRVEDFDDVTLSEPRLREVARDLEEAVRHDPDDLAAWEGLGIANWRLGSVPQALQCFETVLRQSPRREFTLASAAPLAAAVGRRGESLRYWQEALAINPWIVRYRAELAQALGSLGRWNECEALCRQTIEHFPESHRSRQLLIESLLAQGKPDEAAAEIERWLRFRPADPNQLRQWFERHPLRQR